MLAWRLSAVKAKRPAGSSLAITTRPPWLKRHTTWPLRGIPQIGAVIIAAGEGVVAIGGDPPC